MDFLAGFWNYVIVFLGILTVVVFVHEFGHFFVARWNGVKVEVFSIGFGPEVFGWDDRHGTRWRISALPLVGEPVVGKVRPQSAAEEAGLKAGDRLVSINDQAIERFDDIKRLVMLLGVSPLSVVIDRDGAAIDLILTPHIVERKNILGDMERVPVLGVAADPDKIKMISHTPISALAASVHETHSMVSSTLIGIGQMFNGTRGTDELGGPIRIAKGAGEAAKMGIASVAFYTILLSLNLGLINLFPIPVLDGGHLVFYTIEAILGRPLGEQAQEYGFRVGMFLVLALMVFATRNDLVSLPIWQTIKHWVF